MRRITGCPRRNEELEVGSWKQEVGSVITDLMTKRRRQRQQVAAGAAPAKGKGGGDVPEDEPMFQPLRWPVMKKALAWMAPYRKQYLIGTLVGLAVTLLDMLGPMYIRHLLDNDVPGGAKYGPHFLGTWVAGAAGWFSTAQAERLHAAFTGERQAYFNIGGTILLWATTVTIALLLQRFGMLYTQRVGQSVIFNLRRAVFAHLQRLSMSFYDKTKFGRILTRGTSDIDTMSNTMVMGVNTIVSLLTSMLIGAVTIAITDWRIALSVLWLGPILYYMNIVYRNKIGQQWRIVREHFTRVSTNLVENINGMRVVSAFNRQEENLAHFNELQELNTLNNVRAGQVNGIYQPLLTVVGFMGKVTILIVGCYLAFTTQGTSRPFTVGMLVAVWLYWDWFMNPVLQFGNFYNEVLMAMASAERVFSLLEQKPEVADAADAQALPPIKGTVAFEHVQFGYDPRKPVLHDISFEALAGQTVALVGHTGCGKSTIMNLICRFYLPQKGRVVIDGHDTAGIVGHSLHKQMGIVSQSNYLFSGTVLDNIRYARPEASLAEVEAAARALGSHDILGLLKDGYQTEVGERGSAMSLGQRQLICFTRAFLANPRILMLDEATSAVDTHTEMIIQEALEKLVAHRTTFIVAHRLSTVTRADQVLVLDHGHIIERGTHGSLLAANGKYAELYKQFTREV